MHLNGAATTRGGPFRTITNRRISQPLLNIPLEDEGTLYGNGIWTNQTRPLGIYSHVVLIVSRLLVIEMFGSYNIYMSRAPVCPP